MTGPAGAARRQREHQARKRTAAAIVQLARAA